MENRVKAILNAIVESYIQTAEPVGSRTLSKQLDIGLSPATIRNVMADLSEQGYLEQPHTSAGRVPTAKGYRFYVDSLSDTRQLTAREVDRIKQSLEQETDPGELMSKTSQVLSTLSNNVGFVLAPPISRAAMKHIKFIRIAKKRILVVLVTGSGFVQHRLIQTDQDFSQRELNQAGRYLVAHFEGKTLLEIRLELLRLMLEEKSLYDQMLKNVTLLGAATFVQYEGEEDEESEVYLGSTAGMIRKPELADINKMTVLLETFEEKSRLVKIVTECLKANSSGPTVRIGLEKHIPGMRDWALITSPYHCDQKAIGSLGILGPSRMEYDKAISLVDYVAKLFGKLLNSA